jgi:tol-pal system protein YbgF
MVRRANAHGRLAALVWLALMAAPVGSGPAAAASREQQQLLAELRMLQEQASQLQVSLNALAEVLKAMGARMDDQAAAARKAFADQKLLIDTLSGDVRVVREKLDDTNVRLSSLQQDVEALRTGLQALAASPPPAGASEGPAGSTAPTEPGASPLPAGLPASAPPPPLGVSPQRMYDTAYADYTSGQWALAIAGFEAYIKTYPRTDKTDDAQLYIGEAYLLDGKFEEAVAAYDKVIADYPTGDAVPMAYYKRGLALVRLKRMDEARSSWEAVIKQYPDSDAARLARQGLDRLARPGR